MPTAGRLAGALAFAILGGYLAFLCVPNFKEGQMPGWWFPLSVLVGVWAGWVVVGKRTGRGYSSGIGNGLTGMAALVFWVLFILSFMDMIQKSMRRSYDGPVEAVVNVFELLLENAQQLVSAENVTAALVGGVIAGLFAEFFGRRFP